MFDDSTCCRQCNDCKTLEYERTGRNGKTHRFLYCNGGLEEVEYAKWWIDNRGYARSTNKPRNGKAVLFHTLFKKNEWNVIDHINGYRDDNRLCNLRECSPLENMHNLHRNKFSKYPGVMYNKKRGYWYALTRARGVRRNYLGCFDTEEEAYHAYVTCLQDEGKHVNVHTEAHKEYLVWLKDREQQTLL